jgi:hypothetical protein
MSILHVRRTAFVRTLVRMVQQAVYMVDETQYSTCIDLAVCTKHTCAAIAIGYTASSM